MEAIGLIIVIVAFQLVFIYFTITNVGKYCERKHNEFLEEMRKTTERNYKEFFKK